MPSTVEPMTARPRPDDQLERLFDDGWPAFITADEVAKQYIGPVRWNGDPADLPVGYTDSLVRAVQGQDRGADPATRSRRSTGSPRGRVRTERRWTRGCERTGGSEQRSWRPPRGRRP
jgi:hypothetical protein